MRRYYPPRETLKPLDHHMSAHSSTIRLGLMRMPCLEMQQTKDVCIPSKPWAPIATCTCWTHFFCETTYTSGNHMSNTNAQIHIAMHTPLHNLFTCKMSMQPIRVFTRFMNKGFIHQQTPLRKLKHVMSMYQLVIKIFKWAQWGRPLFQGVSHSMTIPRC